MVKIDWSDPIKVREYNRDVKRKKRSENPNYSKEASRKWRESNRPRYRELARNWNNKTRRDRKEIVFSHYSNGKINCNCCGITGIEFLTVDHVVSRKKMEGDTQLMKLGYSAKLIGKDLYKWLEMNNFPVGFQILCWNCNFAKGSLGKCPHERN